MPVLHRISRSQRNPFAYVMPRPVVQQAPVVPTMTPVIAAPAPPQFPYRFIGRFGPAHDPIAAFAGENEIRTVRAGERIDDRFLLRAINLETVHVEASGWPEKILVGLSSAM